MRKQRGQSAVEFALMAPIIFLLIFGMIYGGIMFMDYLNFNNYARTIAREVSLASADRRPEIIDKYNDYSDEAGVYKVLFNVETQDNEDVIVTVQFRRGNSFLILPEQFDIVYRMKLEDTSTSTQ